MTTQQPGLRAGHLVALVGALATLASLWRPWYAIQVPQALRDMLAQEGARAGSSFVGAFTQGLAAALPARLQASGWEELRGADVALCVAALAVVALVVGTSGALGAAVRIDRQAAARWTAGIGIVALGIAVEHVVSRPGANGFVTVHVDLADGIWLALGGALAMAVGGVLGSSPTHQVTTTSPPAFAFDPPAPVEDRTPTSVAPPGDLKW